MKKQKLPWWTWVLPLTAFLGATLLSLPFFTSVGGYWLYFPTNLGIIFALWWGPRVFFATFLNALFCFYLLNLPRAELYPLFALIETFEVMISYYLLKDRFNPRTPWKTNPKYLNQFFIYGLLIPSFFCAAIFQLFLYLAGILPQNKILWSFLMKTVGNLTGAFLLTIPLFILVTPSLYSKNLSRFKFTNRPPLRWQLMTHKEKWILIAVLAGCLALGIAIPLSSTWYAFGVVILMYSAWYGLYASLLMNFWVLGISVILPKFLHLPWAQENIQLETPATLLTLCFCSLLTGSAVTVLFDKIVILRKTEMDLKSAKLLAEEASAAKSDFLARMSHEIRTPLNSVLGMLELLKETQLSSDQSRYLSLFSHAGENLKALINDLLDFSKIEAKALTVENISYDIHTTVRSVFDILQLKAEEKGLHFELNIDADVPKMQWGDPTRLRQVLFNLVGNALKFTQEGMVTIHLLLKKEPPEQLILEVQDTGIGISREKQAGLFSPFFQADDSTTRKYGGTGLGLVISKNLVEIMGGSIEMKSLQGRGTVFRMIIPHRPDLTTKDEKKTVSKYLWNARPPTKPYRLLLVDDSEDNRVLIIHYLKNSPFVCVEAMNGQDAVEKFKNEKFDVVFMDIQMPIMNGYKATELIRHFERESKTRPTPIVALTATAVVEDLKKSLISGCDLYLVKPVKKNEILEALSTVLEKYSASPSRTDVPDAQL